MGPSERDSRLVIHLRWLVVLAVAWLVRPVWPLAGALLVLNGATWAITARPDTFRHWSRTLALWPVLDLAFITLALHPARSAEVGFDLYLLYGFVLIEAMLLSSSSRVRLAWVVGVSGVYLLQAQWGPEEVLPGPALAFRAGVLLAIGAASLYLVREARRERRQRQVLERLAGLLAVGRALGQTRSQDELLERIVQEARSLLHAGAGAVFLEEAETGELVRHAASGALPEPWAAARLPVATESGRVREVWAALRRGETKVEHAEGRDAATALYVPLQLQDRVLGLLTLHELPSSPFPPEEDRNLVLALAAQAAVAIENARLLAEAERRATTDFLTGLYNRAFFHDTLHREVSGSVRYGYPTSLLLLDLDDFKQVNDTHGHRAGDEVLRRLGDLLRSQCRESDFPARYGGEEFAVILTHTGAEGAQVAAERLRTAVSRQPWGLESRTSSGVQEVTVSIGIATCPADAADMEALLRAADAALYAAKRAGKDCVRAYAESMKGELVSW